MPIEIGAARRAVGRVELDRLDVVEERVEAGTAEDADRRVGHGRGPTRTWRRTSSFPEEPELDPEESDDFELEEPEESDDPDESLLEPESLFGHPEPWSEEEPEPRFDELRLSVL